MLRIISLVQAMRKPGWIVPLLAVIAMYGKAQETTSTESVQSFLKWVQDSLPEHSGMPPVSDLASLASVPRVATKAWEEKYKNMEGLMYRDATEHDTEEMKRPGSLYTTTKEMVFSAPYDLPAYYSSLVAIGTVKNSQAYLSTDKHFVYSSYSLNVERLFKSTDPKSRQPILPLRVDVIRCGGGLRFPSGHVRYFILHGSGFPEIGKQYIVFLVKASKKMKAYEVAAMYLVANDSVYTMDPEVSTAYNGSDYHAFEKAVESSVIKRTFVERFPNK